LRAGKSAMWVRFPPGAQYSQKPPRV